jgi:CRP/FNR family transcriptional regulator, cyclic AMP receptor protein
MSKQIHSALRQIPVFSSCSERELKAVARLGAVVSVEAGHILTKQGRLGREFFVVLTGSATCHVDEDLVATFGPGDFFGEMGLVDRQPRSATVRATTAMEVLVIDSREFATLLAESLSTTRKILAELSKRVRAAQTAPQAGV